MNQFELISRERFIGVVVFLLMGTCGLQAQEILNITHIPSFPMNGGTTDTKCEDLVEIDGTVYAVIDVADNNIIDYIPELQIDSFYSALNPITGNYSSSGLFLEYTPYEGFTDYKLLNHMIKDLGSFVDIDGSRISYSRDRLSSVGFDSDFVRDTINEEGNEPESISAVYVYDTELDSLLYQLQVSEPDTPSLRQFFMMSALDGDYLYLNIGASWNYRGPLYIFGDTVTFDYPSIYSNSINNFLFKIDITTGEKVWSKKIGRGDLQKIFIDENHNINIDMIADAPPTIDGVALPEDLPDYYVGANSRLIYRFTSDGEYVYHTTLYTRGDIMRRTVDFNDDGSFQLYGGFNYPMTLYIQDDSLDFNFISSPNDFRGLTLVYDEDFNFEWGQVINCLESCFARQLHKNKFGEYILGVRIREDRVWVNDDFYAIDDNETYETKYGIFKFDETGGIKGEPYFYNKGVLLYDIKTLAEDHHLILFERTGDTPFGFLDMQLDGPEHEYGNHTYIVEVKGDLFDVMTMIEESSFDLNSLNVYPNPVSQGGTLTVKLSETLGIQNASLKLRSLKGDLIVDMPIRSSEYSTIMALPENITSGQYILSLINKENKISKIIYIN